MKNNLYNKNKHTNCENKQFHRYQFGDLESIIRLRTLRASDAKCFDDTMIVHEY